MAVNSCELTSHFRDSPRTEVNKIYRMGRIARMTMEIPGAMADGATIDEATRKVQALALRVLAERLEYGEVGAEEFVAVSFHAAWHE